MLQRDRRAIVIMSDLHLAGGRGATVDPNEQFAHDDAFARLLAALRSRGSTPWRLLLLGDVFDFPRARMAVRRDQRDAPNAAVDIDIAALDRIAAGHPGVFAALRETLAAGVAIDIVPGNHDIELMRPTVQARLSHLLAPGGGITVHPWIVYLPGVLYAEHGNQYHDINSFAALLAWSRTSSDTITMPVGAVLDEFLLDLRERIRRQATDVNGDGSAARTRRALATLPRQVRFLGSVGRHLAYSRARLTAERAAYRAAAVRPYADELGLRYETVVAIDDLAANAAMGLRGRLASTLALDPLRRRLERTSRGDAAGARRARYLHSAATGVHGILQTDGNDVPFYVFGHSHLAERSALGPSAGAPVYLNPGSWTVSEPAAPGRPATHPNLAFVDIDIPPDTGVPTARLARWDDARGTIEPGEAAGHGT